MGQDCLHELARLYGVQTAYVDVDGRRRSAGREALIAAVRAMGAPLGGSDDAPQVLRQRRQSLWRTLMDPVVVAWQGGRGRCVLRVAQSLSGGAYRCLLEIEGAAAREYGGRLRDLPTRDLPTRGLRLVEGDRYVVKSLPLPADLPCGYHRLTVELGGRSASALVLAAPRQAFGEAEAGGPTWGAFLPLHALHRRSSWGGGDLGDLAALAEWIADQGGSAVQVLPLLSELRELGDGPAPYEPSTKLFWDEFYLDVTALDHLSHCRAARELLGRAAARKELAALRAAPLIDYAAQMRLKRQVLEALSQWYFAGADQTGLAEYLRRQGLVETYSRFRAVGERLGVHWDRWPQPMRGGRIRPRDYDPRARQYYLYTQWQMDEQLARVAGQARQRGVKLCLDLPLGVRRDGFDTWRESGLFVRGIGLGAPPDAFFREGQNWRFPPVHPQRQREQGYRYFRACLRRHLEHAGVLRLDHVMGLHRLYWVPDGMPATGGVYVRYPAEEMFAILTLESQRHQAMIVGENLGTVPPAVNRDLHRRRVHSMYVVPFEISARRRPPMRPPPSDCVASLNTHDLPPFAAFWQGGDIDDRLLLGLLDAASARRERIARQALRRALLKHLGACGFSLADDSTSGEVLEACLAALGASAAQMVLVNVEDLWGETRPQNTPGVVRERPNWRCRARYSLGEFALMPGVARILAALDRARRGPRPMGLRRSARAGRSKP